MVKSLLKKVIKSLRGQSDKPAATPVAPATEPNSPHVYRPSAAKPDAPRDHAPRGEGERRERGPHSPRPPAPEGEASDRPPRRRRRRRSGAPRPDGEAAPAHATDAAAPAADRPPRPPREPRDDRGPREHRGPREPREHREPRRRPEREAAPESADLPASNPAGFDAHEGWTIQQYDVPVEHGKTRFYDLNVNDRILHAVSDLGFQYCTPIQAEVLPHTLLGRDAFGQAQTGTGKTAAFMIAIIDYMLRHPIEGQRPVGRPRALIIAPTRELVMQIHKDAVALSKYTGFECAALFGGMDYERQQRQLQNKVIDIVSATPGRMLDFKRRGDLNLSGVEILVIDEADRMLDMGFIPDVREIVHSTPPKSKRQTMLFSATLSDDIRRMASQWTNDPVTITIAPESVAVDTVEQIIYIVTLTERFALVHHVLSQPNMERAIIFVNRRFEAERLADQLDRYGFNCDLLSGAVPQNKRMKTLEAFREGKINVLVATDVAGRGLHVDGVSHVINFSMPDDPEDYVHRIGRTGRAGTSGISISFATEDDAYQIPKIEEYIGRPLPCTHPEDAMLVLPDPPPGYVPKRRERVEERPRRPGPGGGRGGPRSGGRPPRRS